MIIEDVLQFIGDCLIPLDPWITTHCSSFTSWDTCLIFWLCPFYYEYETLGKSDNLKKGKIVLRDLILDFKLHRYPIFYNHTVLFICLKLLLIFFLGWYQTKSVKTLQIKNLINIRDNLVNHHWGCS